MKKAETETYAAPRKGRYVYERPVKAKNKRIKKNCAEASERGMNGERKLEHNIYQ